METIFKIISGTLLTVIIGLVLSKQNKDLWVVLSICVCCMVMIAAIQHLKPILTFFEFLQQKGNIDNQLFQIILKAVGIGLLAEITALLCTDSGNAALGKCIHIVAVVTVLWLSIPLMEELFELIETILKNV